MDNKQENNIHGGHRERLRKLYLSSNIDMLDDHQVLELILTYSIPRIDVNPIAHRLISHFGSLSAVFDASIAELCSVPGVGKNSALLISFFRQVERRYHIDDVTHRMRINNVSAAGKYLAPFFISENNEVVYALSVATNGKILRCCRLFEGSVNEALINTNKIIELALASGTVGIILAHNHPHGSAIPSQKDLETTDHILNMLTSICSMLVDHLIFADGDFVSLSDSGYIDSLKKVSLKKLGG